MNNDEWIIGLLPDERKLIVDLLLEARDNTIIHIHDTNVIEQLLTRLT